MKRESMEVTAARKRWFPRVVGGSDIAQPPSDRNLRTKTTLGILTQTVYMLVGELKPDAGTRLATGGCCCWAGRLRAGGQDRAARAGSCQ